MSNGARIGIGKIFGQVEALGDFQRGLIVAEAIFVKESSEAVPPWMIWVQGHGSCCEIDTALPIASISHHNSDHRHRV